ncbi:hypothetical protein ADUPG1_003754, partial [Aduncisulcus paluster]
PREEGHRHGSSRREPSLNDTSSYYKDEVSVVEEFDQQDDSHYPPFQYSPKTPSLSTALSSSLQHAPVLYSMAPPSTVIHPSKSPLSAISSANQLFSPSDFATMSHPSISSKSNPLHRASLIPSSSLSLPS